MSRILLAIDTSGARLQLALSIGAQIDILVKDIELGRFSKGFAEIIFDEIAKILKRNNIIYQQLERICVATGPGSFTGLRVGISAARGLALGLDIETIGIPNLLALSLTNETKNFAIVVDARRNQAYTQNFYQAGEPMGEVKLLDFEHAFKTHKKHKFDDAIIDMKSFVDFGQSLDVAKFPANPCYVREADAKVQSKGLVI